MEKCASDLGDLRDVKKLFGGTVAESVIQIHYCGTKGGCVPFPGVPGSPVLATDYFDEQQGFSMCRSMAAFLKLHNPFVDEVLIATQCEMPKPTPADKFAVPDIITDQTGRTEFYEIKPLGPSGISAGRTKIRNFLIFCQINAMNQYIPGLQYSPNEDRPITIQLWLGVPARFRFRFVRTEAGLILWDICIEANTNILFEAVWKSMLTRLMIALLFLVPEVTPVLVLAQANLMPEAGSLAGLGDSVGEGGANTSADVQAVQLMLTDWCVHSGRNEIGIDGLVGPITIGAIRDFQQSVLGFNDGRVDPGGQTITALEQAHLQSIVSPDPDLILEPDIQAALSGVSLDSIDSIDDFDSEDSSVFVGPALERFQQMLRTYFLELRNG